MKKFITYPILIVLFSLITAEVDLTGEKNYALKGYKNIRAWWMFGEETDILSKENIINAITSASYQSLPSDFYYLPDKERQIGEDETLEFTRQNNHETVIFYYIIDCTEITGSHGFKELAACHVNLEIWGEDAISNQYYHKPFEWSEWTPKKITDTLISRRFTISNSNSNYLLEAISKYSGEMFSDLVKLTKISN